MLADAVTIYEMACQNAKIAAPLDPQREKGQEVRRFKESRMDIWKFIAYNWSDDNSLPCSTLYRSSSPLVELTKREKWRRGKRR